mgnify:CR=1 FL=1
MIVKTLLYVFLFTYSLNLFATNIRVLNLQSIIDNNNAVENLISLIENDQIKFIQNFKTKEKELEIKLEKIKELELILDPLELDKEIVKYNDELNNFNIEVQKLNNHYDNQINSLKSQILETVLEILKKYALDNQIDLILDANNYILSSDSMDITSTLIDEINKLKFNISFEKF